MAIHLGANQYGKAESRVVRIYRDTARHQIRDLNVSSALRGRFEDAHTTGDQSEVLPTDTQKNTAFAFAKEKGVGAIEEFALTLGDHFLDGAASRRRRPGRDRGVPVGADLRRRRRPRPLLRPQRQRYPDDGRQRRRPRLPSARRTSSPGIRDLTVLKSTGSEFHGFLKDKYTTLPETDDRILATSLVARWRYDHTDVDWDKSYDEIKGLLLEQFARIHSLALQQTLYGMGEAVLQQHPEVAEIKFSAPNKHHFLVDLSPFERGEPGRGVHRRGPPVRADRGDRGARRRQRRGVGLARGTGVLLDRHRRMRPSSRSTPSGASWPPVMSLLDGNRIVAVGTGPAPAYDGARVIDGRGCLVTPGFVNTHQHLYQWVTRGLAADAGPCSAG